MPWPWPARPETRSCLICICCSHCWRRAEGIGAGVGVWCQCHQSPRRRRAGSRRYAKQSDAQPSFSRELTQVVDAAEREGQDTRRRIRLHRTSPGRALRCQGHRQHAIADGRRRSSAGAAGRAQARARAHRSPTRAPSSSTRRCRSSRATSPNRHARANSIPSSDVTRNPSCHPGALAPHQKQPGAHRRTRRGQDRHRRRIAQRIVSDDVPGG